MFQLFDSLLESGYVYFLTLDPQGGLGDALFPFFLLSSSIPIYFFTLFSLPLSELRTYFFKQRSLEIFNPCQTQKKNCLEVFKGKAKKNGSPSVFRGPENRQRTADLRWKLRANGQDLCSAGGCQAGRSIERLEGERL